MRLTSRQVKLYKEYSDSRRVPEKIRPMIESLFDTVEALQKEKAELKKRLETSPYGDDKIDELEEVLIYNKKKNEWLVEVLKQAKIALQIVVDDATHSNRAVTKNEFDKVNDAIVAIDRLEAVGNDGNR